MLDNRLIQSAIFGLASFAVDGPAVSDKYHYGLPSFYEGFKTTINASRFIKAPFDRPSQFLRPDWRVFFANFRRSNLVIPYHYA